MTPFSQTFGNHAKERTALACEPRAGAVRKPVSNETRRDARLYFSAACAKLRQAIKARKTGDHYNYRSLRWQAAWFLEYRHKLLEDV